MFLYAILFSISYLFGFYIPENTSTVDLTETEVINLIPVEVTYGTVNLDEINVTAENINFVDVEVYLEECIRTDFFDLEMIQTPCVQITIEEKIILPDKLPLNKIQNT